MDGQVGGGLIVHTLTTLLCITANLFFPYHPNQPIVDNATFKTYEYVVSELEVITCELNHLLDKGGL